jgi:hypothetical protein
MLSRVVQGMEWSSEVFRRNGDRVDPAKPQESGDKRAHADTSVGSLGGPAAIDQ